MNVRWEYILATHMPNVLMFIMDTHANAGLRSKVVQIRCFIVEEMDGKMLQAILSETLVGYVQKVGENANGVEKYQSHLPRE